MQHPNLGSLITTQLELVQPPCVNQTIVEGSIKAYNFLLAYYHQLDLGLVFYCVSVTTCGGRSKFSVIYITMPAVVRGSKGDGGSGLEEIASWALDLYIFVW